VNTLSTLLNESHNDILLSDYNVSDHLFYLVFERIIRKIQKHFHFRTGALKRKPNGRLNCSLDPPSRPTVLHSIHQILTLVANLPHNIIRLQQFSLVMLSAT